MEQYNKREYLLFVGIPTNPAGIVGMDVTDSTELSETSNSLTDTILDIAQKTLKVLINPKDLSIVHRIPSKGVTYGAPSSVMVRFTSRAARDAVFKARFKLKNSNLGYWLFINEDLTIANQKIFGALRQKLKDEKIKSV